VAQVALEVVQVLLLVEQVVLERMFMHTEVQVVLRKDLPEVEQQGLAVVLMRLMNIW
tara:strand:- start:330 stop:500 length:171 start_codon:yes stop_codon:yes gene_type:complete